MQTFTFNDQLNLLSVLLGDDNTSTSDMFPITIRKLMINRGEVRLAMDARDLRGYVTGTVTNYSIPIPDDFHQVFALVVNNRDVTRFETALQDYERYLNSSDGRWYQWEQNNQQYLKFLGTAQENLSFNLWYFRVPLNVLDNLTDVSEHNIKHREASVYWAAQILMTQIGKTDLATQYLNMYQLLANDCLTDIKERYMNRPIPKVDTGDEQGISTVDVEGKGFVY